MNPDKDHEEVSGCYNNCEKHLKWGDRKASRWTLITSGTRDSVQKRTRKISSNKQQKDNGDDKTGHPQGPRGTKTGCHDEARPDKWRRGLQR